MCGGVVWDGVCGGMGCGMDVGWEGVWNGMVCVVGWIWDGRAVCVKTSKFEAGVERSGEKHRVNKVRQEKYS